MNEIEPLSPQGEARKRQILQRAKAQARQLRRRRQTVRVAGVAMILLIGGSIVWHPQEDPGPAAPFAGKPIESPDAPLAHMPDQPTVKPAGAGKVIITTIHTQAGLSQRYVVKPSPQTWEILNDDQLLEHLAAAGKPAALARIDGKKVLLFDR